MRNRILKPKWIVLIVVVVFLAFYAFYGLPPTSANHAPAYLRIDRDVRESNVVTWVGLADHYEVISYRGLFARSSYHFVAEEFYRVSEPRFEEGNIIEGLTYQYRVRVVDKDGAPVSRWSRSVKRTLDIQDYGDNVFTNPPTPVPEP